MSLDFLSCERSGVLCLKNKHYSVLDVYLDTQANNKKMRTKRRVKFDAREQCERLVIGEQAALDW